MKKSYLVLLFVFCFNIVYANQIPLSVKIAQKELGNGEMYGDNRGPDIKKYMQGKEGLSWCTGFVSYCLINGGYKIPYTLRAKDFLNLGVKVKDPSIGDILVLDRGKYGGHVGIIEDIDGDEITTIEGNVGKYPAKVRRVFYKKGHIKNFIAFRRIK